MLNGMFLRFSIGIMWKDIKFGVLLVFNWIKD